jgi:phospholipid/cholesterol/gamma-HCH transport system substrate-binding protein
MAGTERLRLEVKRSGRSVAIVAMMVALGLTSVVLIFSHISFHNPFASTYDVNAIFSDVKGSDPGHEPIYIAGVKIGVVAGERIVHGDEAKLSLAIDSGYAPLYRDATIVERPLTPLQDMYLTVTRGSPSAGRLPPGGTIPIGQTGTPVDISRVLDTFTAPTSDRLHSLLLGLGSGLADHGQELRAAFVQLFPLLSTTAQVMRAVAVRQRNLASLVHVTADLGQALGQRDAQIAELVRSGDRTLATIAANDAPFSATLSELPGAVSALQSSMRSLRVTAQSLDPAVSSLRPVAAQLPAGLSALQRFANQATPALLAARTPLRALDPLAISLRPTSSSLAGALSRLEPQDPRLDFITQRLQGCEGPVASFFQNTMSVFKWGDANGTFPRADESLNLSDLSGVTGLNVDPEFHRLTDGCVQP